MDIERSHGVVLKDDRVVRLGSLGRSLYFAGKDYLLFEFNGELAAYKPGKDYLLFEFNGELAAYKWLVAIMRGPLKSASDTVSQMLALGLKPVPPLLVSQ